jgi:hypothetical protein
MIAIHSTTGEATVPVNRIDVRVAEDYANPDFDGFRDLPVSDALLVIRKQIGKRRAEASRQVESQLFEAIAALDRGDKSPLDAPYDTGDELMIIDGDRLVAFRRERVTLTLTITFDAEDSALIDNLPEVARETLDSYLAT